MISKNRYEEKRLKFEHDWEKKRREKHIFVQFIVEYGWKRTEREREREKNKTVQKRDSSTRIERTSPIVFIVDEIRICWNREELDREWQHRYWFEEFHKSRIVSEHCEEENKLSWRYHPMPTREPVANNERWMRRDFDQRGTDHFDTHAFGRFQT